MFGSIACIKLSNVYFVKRYLSIEKIIGMNIPQLNPFKIVAANNPVDCLAGKTGLDIFDK